MKLYCTKIYLAAILKNGGLQGSTTPGELSPWTFSFYTFLRFQRYMTRLPNIIIATRSHMLIDLAKGAYFVGHFSRNFV